MIIPELDTVLLWFGKVTAAVTVIGTFYKLVFVPTWRWGTKLSALPDQVNMLMAEFKSNGGASLRDSIERIELTTARAEERQKVLLSLVPYGLVETDSAGRLIFTNRTYLRWTGRTDDELYGDGWFIAVHVEDQSRVAAEWEKAVRQKRAWEGRFRIVNVDGGTIPVFLRAYPMYYGMIVEESPFGWIAILFREDGIDHQIAPISHREVVS